MQFDILIPKSNEDRVPYKVEYVKKDGMIRWTQNGETYCEPVRAEFPDEIFKQMNEVRARLRNKILDNNGIPVDMRAIEETTSKVDDQRIKVLKFLELCYKRQSLPDNIIFLLKKLSNEHDEAAEIIGEFVGNLTTISFGEDDYQIRFFDSDRILTPSIIHNFTIATACKVLKIGRDEAFALLNPELKDDKKYKKLCREVKLLLNGVKKHKYAIEYGNCFVSVLDPLNSFDGASHTMLLLNSAHIPGILFREFFDFFEYIVTYYEDGTSTIWNTYSVIDPTYQYNRQLKYYMPIFFGRVNDYVVSSDYIVNQVDGETKWHELFIKVPTENEPNRKISIGAIKETSIYTNTPDKIIQINTYRIKNQTLTSDLRYICTLKEYPEIYYASRANITIDERFLFERSTNE